MDKDVYNFITELWKFIKKYLAGDNTTEEYWDNLRVESSKLYRDTEGQPEYFREAISKFIHGAVDIIEGKYREEHK